MRRGARRAPPHSAGRLGSVDFRRYPPELLGEQPQTSMCQEGRHSVPSAALGLRGLLRGLNPQLAQRALVDATEARQVADAGAA